MELHHAEGMRSHCQCGDLRIRQNGDTHFAVMRFRGELTFIECGHAACIVSDGQIGVGFVDHGFDLAKHRIRAGEVALNQHMTETKSAAIEPRGIIRDVDAEFFEQGGHNRGALSAVDFGIVDGIFGDDLVVMAGGMNRCCDGAHVHELTFFESIAHGVDPLAVMDDLFRDDERFAHLIENAANFIAQVFVMHKLLADFLVMSK